MNVLGAFLCFCLSGIFGSELQNSKYLKGHFQRLLLFVKKETKSGNIFFYLVSLRLLPVTPNWAMNIIFPHIGIPPLQFALSVGIGLAPWNYISCSAGVIISEIMSRSEIMTAENYIIVHIPYLISISSLEQLWHLCYHQ